VKKNKLKVFISCAVLFSSLSIFGVSAFRDTDQWRAAYNVSINKGKMSRQDADNYANIYSDEYARAIANGKTLLWAVAYANQIATGHNSQDSALYADMFLTVMSWGNNQVVGLYATTFVNAINGGHSAIWATAHADEIAIRRHTHEQATAHANAFETAYTRCARRNNDLIAIGLKTWYYLY
jgi:hypothetical protein